MGPYIDERPIAFLVSTTPHAKTIRTNLGSVAYSYYFVLEALAPVLDALGTWRLIDRPESRLAFAAMRAEAEGYRPVHLAINPPQDAYFSPELPNILFPFWEFPDLPDRPFGLDPRHHWPHVCRGADLILAACRFTADAFRDAGVSCTVAEVPVPLDPSFFDLSDWRADRQTMLVCRHEIWGEETDVTAESEPASRSPAKRLYRGLRQGYRRHVRPYLSNEGLARMTHWRERTLRAMGRESVAEVDPLLPKAPLELSGLVYTSLLSVGDARKNWPDLLSAFLTAFRDRSDATLVIKLATTPRREPHEMSILRDHYRRLGIRHRCRVAIVTDFLDEDQLTGLINASTYYVNTSHAEGACLPLMRALAGGRPAIAPRHSAMADYMDKTVGFVPRSHPEPARWPHDPEGRLETSHHRLVWSDLVAGFVESASIIRSDPSRYAALSTAARGRMESFAARSVTVAALRRAVAQLPLDQCHRVRRSSVCI